MARETNGQAVTGLDAGFLHLECESSPMNGLAIVWVDDSDGPRFTHETFTALFPELIRRDPIFSARLTTDSHGRRPEWVHGPVALDHHVERVVAPPGAGADFVLEVAARVMSRRLSRDRPLWKYTVIEGIDGPDGATVALVAVFHHARYDGLSALRAFATLAGAPAVAPEPVGAPTGPWGRLVRQARGTSGLVRAAWRGARRERAGERVPYPPWKTPRLSISRSLTAARELAFVDLPVADVSRIRRAFGVTFNDAFLAIVTGALRTWLGEDRPDGPVVTMVPLSVRGDDLAAGNRISAYFAGLPVHLDDPAARIHDVAAEMAAVKVRHEDFAAVGLDAFFDTLPWRFLGGRVRRYCDRDRADTGRLIANLSATSVAGSREPLTLLGARVVGIQPFGPIVDGITVNVSGLSYGDRLRIGITGAPGIGDGVTALAGAIAEEADRLLAVVDRTGSP